MSASMVTPRAASRSAEPEREESARLPCLATGTPQPAATSAAAVEMLKVPLASPPVPQVSMVPSGASIFSARARIACAPPVISSTVSPRTRSGHEKAAHLGWRRLARHHRVEGGPRFVHGERRTARDTPYERLEIGRFRHGGQTSARLRAGRRLRRPPDGPRVIAGSRRNAMRGNASSNDRSWHSVRGFRLPLRHDG